MSHVRTQVRDLVVAALKDIPDMKFSVFASRVTPLQQDRLPAILVYTTEEAVEIATIGPPRLQLRQLAIMVDIVISLRDVFDEELDAFQIEVEKILGGAAFLGDMTTAKIKDFILISAVKTMSGEPDTTTCATRMMYRADYTTRENDPETLI